MTGGERPQLTARLVVAVIGPTAALRRAMLCVLVMVVLLAARTADTAPSGGDADPSGGADGQPRSEGAPEGTVNEMPDVFESPLKTYLRSPPKTYSRPPLKTYLRSPLETYLQSPHSR